MSAGDTPPVSRAQSLVRLLGDPELSRAALDRVADDPEARELVERAIAAGVDDPTRSLLATGGALRGPTWERVAERLLGPALHAGDRLRRYVLLEEVGAGGMGVVWAAWDPELDRKVALKLLFPLADATAGGDRERLLAEARALAALSHPNVVQVFDVGEVGGQVFLTMEFVEGGDLRVWCAAEPRSWRELLDRCLDAGRGLAAAHDAGIVHRDFKPQNVLLGEDGRVRVVDFGLARPAASANERGGERAPIAGTPGYMAPEQLAGVALDARGDQFAFCVTLWEAWHGERPYPGSTFDEMKDLYARSPAPPRRESRVPRRLLAVVERGLALDPASRWPSLGELLDALERAARPRWTRRLSLAAAVLAAALASGLLVRGTLASPCRNLEAPLVAIWNPARATELAARFEATGLDTRSPARLRTLEAIERWTGSWLGERRLACAAAHEAEALSPELAHLQVACFDRRLRELDALIGVLGDSESLLDAPKAALGLESPRVCADVELLAAPERPPRDAEAAARLAELERSLAQGKALRDAGRLPEAAARAEAALGDAAALDYLPIRAELTLLHADALERLGEFDRAEAQTFAAWSLAERSGHQEVAIRALTLLTFLDGNDRARFDRSRRWTALAEARLARLAGGAPHLAAQLANDSGSALQAEGRLDEALAAHRRALELRQAIFGRDSVEAAKSWNNLGSVRYSQGRIEESLADFRRAGELLEARLGSDHPDVAMSASNIGASLNALRRPAEGRAELQRALEIRTARFGAGSIWWAVSQLNLGLTALLDRPLDSLAPIEEARAVFESHGLGEHPFQAYALGGLGRAWLARNDPGRALALLDRSLEIAAAGGILPDHLAEIRFARARALWRLAPPSPSARELAREVLEEVRARDYPDRWLVAEIETWLEAPERRRAGDRRVGLSSSPAGQP